MWPFFYHRSQCLCIKGLLIAWVEAAGKHRDSYFTKKRCPMFLQKEVLKVSDVNVRFINHGKTLHVIRDVSFGLERCSRTAILGETGCGKSVMAMALFRLLSENAVVTGGLRLNESTDI